MAGRLGHGGGGSTTLKVYAAWVSESDQRASTSLFSRMPVRPESGATAAGTPMAEPRSPYEKIAAQLRREIEVGVIPIGEPIPTVAELAATHSVALSTAQRAVSLLKASGLVDAARGQRARVVSAGTTSTPTSGDMTPASDTLTGAGSAPGGTDHGKAAPAALQLWEIVLRGPDGRRYPARHVTADLRQPDQFRRHLLSIARIEAPTVTNNGDDWVGNFELEVRELGQGHKDPKLTLRWEKS